MNDKHCKSGNTSDTKCLNINFRKLEALIRLSEVFARSHLELQDSLPSYRENVAINQAFDACSTLQSFCCNILKSHTKFDAIPWDYLLHTMYLLLSWLTVFSYLHPFFLSEEEAFQSPSSTTLRFLVSVLPEFFLKVSPTLSTNSKGNALHALRSRLSHATNVLQSWDPILSSCNRYSKPRICAILNIFGTLGSELGELQHLMFFLSLKFLRLINNQLTRTIPKEFTTLSNLKVFDASNNDLCETIPIDPRNNK
ncbi:hypothetical protein HHK36_027230 [Tetracentron sinense]|uniref:Uncharacterized protein n=1 Tax=Tetracentron sinense TaxID=13715 RepID=A0A834YIC5_TETSI|nr:hypothetical protein HHK36_027230 [Tetracentron sinense]